MADGTKRSLKQKFFYSENSTDECVKYFDSDSIQVKDYAGSESNTSSSTDCWNKVIKIICGLTPDSQHICRLFQ